jgi:Raf kinase inhibitor-like YbhB/YbcL family protein
MTIIVDSWQDGGEIPVRFTQAAPGVAPGGGLSPGIRWDSPPAGTQSFLLHLHDLDVSHNMTADDQVHWLVWNIPGSVDRLAEGVAPGRERPDGSYQISVSGPWYRGPGAPADGPFHHYVVELYALNIPLNLLPIGDAFTVRNAVFQATFGHILAKSVCACRFRSPQPME